MNKKTLIVYGIIFMVVQFLISSGIFVTYQGMTAYAAPKEDITEITQHLIRIENKIDKLILERR